MVNFKKIIVGVLSVSLFSTCIFTPALASTNEKIPASISSSVNFKKENSASAKNWATKTKDTVKTNLVSKIEKEKDEKNKLKLQEVLKKQDKFEPLQFFKDNSDGSTSLVTKLPFVQVKVGDYTTSADANGEFYLEGISKGEYPLEVSYDGFIVNKSTIKIGELKSSERFNIVIDREDTEFASSFKKMGDSHKENMKESNQETMEVYGAQVYATSGSIIYFPQIPRLSRVPWSKDPGGMYIAKDTNVVGCNKADNYTLDKAYETGSFPFNDSDCAVSIWLGFAYASDPLSYSYQPMTYYCWIEALGNDSSEENIYCNGKTEMSTHQSKGIHTNCSWFDGVNHPEELHAHN